MFTPWVRVGVGLGDTPKTVPVSWARVGLLVELRVADTQAGGPAV